MRYSIEPKDRRYVKGYGFLYFAKNIGKNIGKNISNKYSKKLVDSVKKIFNRFIKNCFKKSNSKNSRSKRRFNW